MSFECPSENPMHFSSAAENNETSGNEYLLQMMPDALEIPRFSLVELPSNSAMSQGCW